MHTWNRALRGVLLVFALGVSTPAFAQEYWQRVDRAQREMREVEQSERFPLAADQCRRSIANRTAQWMIVWCDLAATAAVNNRDRERRRDYSDAERSLLWDAAWLQALEGIQDNSLFAAPLVERVSIADAVSNQRLIAYRLLSALRTRDYRDIDTYARQLAGLEDIAINQRETFLAGRRRLIETLLARPRTPERLWAIAAIALTYELEYPSAGVSADDVTADAREMAASLAGLEADAEAFTGQDAALVPLLLHAQAKVLWIARDYAAGQRAGQAGHAACIARLWESASLCLDLGMEGAFAGILNEFAAINPELMMLPPDPALSSRRRGHEYTEARCRVIITGDADDDGRFVNVRIAYENPARICRAMAMRYVSDRSYRPIAEATPGTRRQNLVIRFVLTSP